MSNASTQRRLSSRNPFSTPPLSPNLTGASATSTLPSYHSTVPFSHTLLTPTPTGMSTVSSAPSYHTAVETNGHSDEALPPRIPSRDPPSRPLPSFPASSNNTGNSQNASPSLPPQTFGSAPQPPSSTSMSDFPPDLMTDDLPESAPPAYSLTPDIGGGEIALEQDPPEPFQPEPEPLVQPPQPDPYPPPAPPSPFPESPLSRLSDPEVLPSPTTPLQEQPRYAPPPGPPPPPGSVRQQSRFAPPSGAPPPGVPPPGPSPPGPPPPSNRPRAATASTVAGAGSTVPHSRNGYPTSRPMPGHPLLLNGRLLVYPETYLCPKCKPGFHSFHFILHGISRRQQHRLQKL
jgi:hypothetical protein